MAMRTPDIVVPNAGDAGMSRAMTKQAMPDHENPASQRSTDRNELGVSVPVLRENSRAKV